MSFFSRCRFAATTAVDRSARVDGGLFVGLGQTWQAADAIAITHALSQARRPMTSDNPQLPEANMQNWSEDTVRHLREHYDEAATYWGKWADPMAEQQIKVNQALLVAASVKPGAQLLDLASGAGEPAVTASAMRADGEGAGATNDAAWTEQRQLPSGRHGSAAFR
jgi:hypothetical protein